MRLATRVAKWAHRRGWKVVYARDGDEFTADISGSIATGRGRTTTEAIEHLADQLRNTHGFDGVEGARESRRGPSSSHVPGAKGPQFRADAPASPERQGATA